ncbi:unnamed protein product [Cochlearia groenlandica]
MSLSSDSEQHAIQPQSSTFPSPSKEHEVPPRTPDVQQRVPDVQDPPPDVQDPSRDVQDSVPDVQDPLPYVQDPVEVVMDDVHDIQTRRQSEEMVDDEMDKDGNIKNAEEMPPQPSDVHHSHARDNIQINSESKKVRDPVNDIQMDGIEADMEAPEIHNVMNGVSKNVHVL